MDSGLQGEFRRMEKALLNDAAFSVYVESYLGIIHKLNPVKRGDAVYYCNKDYKWIVLVSDLYGSDDNDGAGVRTLFIEPMHTYRNPVPLDYRITTAWYFIIPQGAMDFEAWMTKHREEGQWEIIPSERKLLPAPGNERGDRPSWRARLASFLQSTFGRV